MPTHTHYYFMISLSTIPILTYLNPNKHQAFSWQCVYLVIYQYPLKQPSTQVEIQADQSDVNNLYCMLTHYLKQRSLSFITDFAEFIIDYITFVRSIGRPDYHRLRAASKKRPFYLSLFLSPPRSHNICGRCPAGIACLNYTLIILGQYFPNIPFP